MKSFKLGKVFGIELELHWTFLVLFGFLIVSLFITDPLNLVSTIILFLMLFLSVLMHELSHSVVALKKGVNVKKIMLLPIGGVSLMDEIPENPKDEFLISIAGPMFNFVVVFFIVIAVSLFNLPFPTNIASLGAEQIETALLAYPLFALLWINLVLGLFNLLIPALPLDGGRVYRSLLTIFIGRRKATHWMTRISSIIAIFLFILALFNFNIILMVIAVFVYLGAKQEDRIVQVETSIYKKDLDNAVTKNPETLPSFITISDVLQKMIEENKTFYLIKKEKALAFIDLQMINGLKKQELNKSVEEFAKNIPVIAFESSSQKIIDLILTKGSPVIALTKDGFFYGVIFAEDLEKLYSLIKTIKSLK